MAKANIAAGMSIKRPGPVDFSSDMRSLSVELLDVPIDDAAHFRAAASALLAEVKSTLEAEVADGAPAAGNAGRVDLWGAGGNGGADRKPTSRPTQSAGNGDRGKADPISNKQAKFLFQLARRSGMKTQSEVAGWIHEKLGVDRGVYELTKKEASKAIDLLNNGNGGAKR
ncbi:MAG: hypothetical protein ACYTFI_19860 [Planctomycetota bacterium]|jgi:hypothetical protein